MVFNWLLPVVLLLGHTTSLPTTPAAPVQELVPIELRAISMVESHGGEYVDHKVVERGLNRGTAAIGEFGEMPLTIQDTVMRTPSLAPYIAVVAIPPKEVHTYMGLHPELELKVAKSIYAKLHRRYEGNLPKIFWSWLHGSAIGVSDEDLAESVYVQRVLYAYNSLKIQHKMSFADKR